jgi:hypothetical protein
MVQNSLVNYIREQIRAGYDTKSIKKYLLKYNYTESQINEAIQAAYPPSEVKHTLHLSKTTVALTISIIFTIIIASGIFIYMTSRGPSQLLDVRINIITQSIESGDPLSFTAEISNLGKTNRYDVTLMYEIYDLGNNLITFKEETIALETKAASSVTINLGEQFPGNYRLKTKAPYKKGTAEASSSFKITRKTSAQQPDEPITQRPITQEPVTPITPEQCPSNCDDNDQCTTDHCSESTNYECKHDIVLQCCGNKICESDENYETCLADCSAPEEANIFKGKPIWEKIDMISDIAKTNKEQALQYCKAIPQTGYKYDCFAAIAAASDDIDICLNIEDDSYRDSCYKDAAKETRDSDSCSKIVKDSKRDQCYMAFVTKEDYTVCDKLINKYLKQSCESLKKLSEVEIPEHVVIT